MKVLNDRMDTNLSREEAKTFEDAVHVFRTKTEAEAHNLK
jgi:hypothetical protein